MKTYVIPSVKYVLTIMLTLLFVFLCSCTSKSGHLTDIPALSPSVEKIVIIDRIYTPIGYSGDDPIYRYKVKRLNQGVVDFVDIDYPFDTGDTIMYQFWNK